MTWGAAPAVDIAESDKAYEITAELPGLDEKNIRSEARRRLHELHFGSFERCFRVPEGVDADKIEARFKKGV